MMELEIQLFGGRGASSSIILKRMGIDTTKPIKTENDFEIFKEFKIDGRLAKIVRTTNKNEFKTPYENLTPDATYFALDRIGDLKTITYSDGVGERATRVDVKGASHKNSDGKVIKTPHAHDGKGETGDVRELTNKEKRDLKIGRRYINEKNQ